MITISRIRERGRGEEENYALQTVDADELRGIELKSILFPLLGTGTAKGELEQKAKELIEAAISYLEAHPNCRIDRVYFLTWSEKDLEVSQRVLQQAQDVVMMQRVAVRQSEQSGPSVEYHERVGRRGQSVTCEHKAISSGSFVPLILHRPIAARSARRLAFVPADGLVRASA